MYQTYSRTASYSAENILSLSPEAFAPATKKNNSKKEKKKRKESEEK
jgi:hypothetical protein